MRTPPPRNVTKIFTGLLQPTLQEGTGSFMSGRTATQNLAHTRKGKKTAGKDFEIFGESA